MMGMALEYKVGLKLKFTMSHVAMYLLVKPCDFLVISLYYITTEYVTVWANVCSSHNCKYLEISFWNNQFNTSQEGKEVLTCH